MALIRSNIAENRERLILNVLQECGPLTTEMLSKRMGMSESTVRRYLLSLEEQGRIVRSHGKAACRSRMVSEDAITQGYGGALRAKRRIAEAAMAHIRPGSSIMLGGGTTCLELAQRIAKEGPECLVITPSIPVASVLSAVPHVELWLPGGMVYNRSQYLVGEEARSYLTSHFVQMCFVGCDALSLECGLTTVNPLEADIDRLLIRNASKAFLITDSRKLDRTSITRICPVDNLQHIITDTDASGDFLDKLRSQGITVEQV